MVSNQAPSPGLITRQHRHLSKRKTTYRYKIVKISAAKIKRYFIIEFPYYCRDSGEGNR
jgi:hypothetical protein